MRNVRQLTRKNDPKLNILVPKQLIRLVLDAAKAGRRRSQDEVIRRLAATINNERVYSKLKDVVLNKIQ